MSVYRNEKDEFIITRHSQFKPAVNIINCYGEIESRSSCKEIEERWNRLLARILKIEASNEMVILIGDLNKLVGNGEFGVDTAGGLSKPAGLSLSGLVSPCLTYFCKCIKLGFGLIRSRMIEYLKLGLILQEACLSRRAYR